jgi:hypothetical protein
MKREDNYKSGLKEVNCHKRKHGVAGRQGKRNNTENGASFSAHGAQVAPFNLPLEGAPCVSL